MNPANSHRYIPERKTILSAALFADGNWGDECLITFAEANSVQFAATLSECSGQMLRHISIRSLFRIGKRWGGTKISLPDSTRVKETLLSRMIGEAEAKSITVGIGCGNVILPCIMEEFHTHFIRGFIMWADGNAKTGREIALALGVCRRSVSNYQGKLRRLRRPLQIEPFAADFARYWAMIFPQADTDAAEANSAQPAIHVAENFLKANLNALAGNGEHPNHARRPNP